MSALETPPPARGAARLLLTGAQKVQPASIRQGQVGDHGSEVPVRHHFHGFRQAVQLAARAAGATPHGEPVEVVIDAVFARPKSHRKDGPALPRQDVDNLAKSVLDALTGIAWDDDRQVRRLVIEKSYGEARTTVRIT